MTPYYADDLVTIYHGRAEEAVFGDAGALLLTDPPYGISYQHGARLGGVRFGVDEQSIVGDDRPFDPAHLLVHPGPIVLWGANHFAPRLPASRGWLTWDKRDGTPSNDQSDGELAWTNFLTVARVFSARWSGNHRTGREQTDGRLHVNQKPVALMAWCIRLAGLPSSVVDPYMGSGSVLVAAKELGLPSIGIDIDEACCEIAANRCRQEVLGLVAV